MLALSALLLLGVSIFLAAPCTCGADLLSCFLLMNGRTTKHEIEDVLTHWPPHHVVISLLCNKLAYCMLHVLYCSTDVVIIKPVTGRASICSASLKTTRRFTALGFHTEKEVCQNSHSSDPVPFHTICKYTAIYCPTQYINMSK